MIVTDISGLFESFVVRRESFFILSGEYDLLLLLTITTTSREQSLLIYRQRQNKDECDACVMKQWERNHKNTDTRWDLCLLGFPGEMSLGEEK